MPDDPVTRLAELLRVPATDLSALSRFSAAETATLADVVEEAMRVQATEFAAALEAAVGVVPRPLRGTARKMLFGGGRG